MTTTAARATILTRCARYLKKLFFLSFNMSFTAEMKTEEEEEERAATPPAGDNRSRAPTPNPQNPGPVGDNEALTRASPTGPNTQPPNPPKRNCWDSRGPTRGLPSSYKPTQPSPHEPHPRCVRESRGPNQGLP